VRGRRPTREIAIRPPSVDCWPAITSPKRLQAADLSAARGTLSRAATLVDQRADDRPVATLFAETQAAKTFTNDTACRVVDRALAVTGGAGYMSGRPLTRAYRGVRAGAFMHPLGANRAYDLIGRVALGADPAVH